jgi:hypothetical protein
MTRMRLGALAGAALYLLSACAGPDDDPTVVTDGHGETRETFTCIGYRDADPVDSALADEPHDPCARSTDDAVAADPPCDDIWTLGTRLPAAYVGCASSEGDDRVAFELGAVCDDPALDDFWLRGDMMARPGGPVVASTVELLDSGQPEC